MRLSRILISTLLLGSTCIAASDLRQIGMVNLSGQPGFGQSAFANGMLLLTHTGASSVDVFDPVHRRVIAQVTGLQSPRSIAVDEQSGKVYVADHGSQSIAVVAMDGWKVIDSIPLSGSPDVLVLDGDGRLYWSDAANGSVSLVDLRTKQTVSTVAIGGTPRDLAFDQARKLLYVSAQDVHQIVALDPALKIVSRFTLSGSQPSGLVYDPQYKELYVAVRFAVLAISADTGAEIDRVAAPAGVDDLWLDSESRTLYAASNGSLLMIQTQGRLTLADEIPTEVKGHTVAYDGARHLLLLPGGREGKSKLLILRPASNSNGDDVSAKVK
jgi:YVTN family beta-propeller protein